MNKKRIVITGGPGTGKTSIIRSLEKDDFFCFHEYIRSVTQEAIQNEDENSMQSNPIVSVSDPYLFNLQLLEGRVQQYKDGNNRNENVLFYDRGIPDVLAYMKYFDQECPEDFITTCKQHSYDQIFILPPWEEIYVQDEERYESFEQAQQLYACLQSIYKELGYTCIEVPIGPLEERMRFIVKNMI